MAHHEKDWNTNEEFFRFTRGCFLCDEAEQMAQRYVRFNMNELARVAAETVGAAECINIEKCPDGMYNKAFLLTMDNGRQVIGKVPNPNAGLPHFTTASEVATMDFMRNMLGTPVPRVYAWNSKAETHAVGSEFMIMGKVPGVQLREVWRDMKPADKLEILRSVSRYQTAWLSTTFTQIGSLYYAEDVVKQSSEDYLYTDGNGHQVRAPRFAIGPATGRDWFDAGRSSIQYDRGPWYSVSQYRRAVGSREIAAIKYLTHLPRQLAMVCGPGLYIPTPTKKLAALQSYLRVAEFLGPADSSLTTSHLWHDDLHDENIFVDPMNPIKILGIIDWQSAQLAPLVDHNLDPAFLNYDGPDVKGLERPKLPDNFNNLSEQEKAAATTLYINTSMMVAYRRLTHGKNPLLYLAIEFQESEAFSLLHLSRRLYEIGEAHLHAVLADLRGSWKDLPVVRAMGNPPFPLTFSESELAHIKYDAEAATRGLELMDQFKARLGDLWPEKGAVGHEDYERTKALLRQLKDEVLQEYSQSDEDRALFELFWPFDD